MSFPKKAHWTAVLAIGLPLAISGCSQTGDQNSMQATASASTPAPIPSNVNAMMLAQRLEAEGNYANAAIMYQQAVAANPQNVQALLGFGDCSLAVGSIDPAALAYAQALEFDPSNSRALRGLANARIMKGEPQFAVAQLEKAIQVDPHDYKAMNTLGVTHDMLGNQTTAQANYRRILKEDPQNQSAKNNLALSLALSGNTDESIRLLEAIGTSTRSTPISKQNLALVYAAAGRTQDAMMLAQSGAAPGTVQQVAALYSATSQEDKKILLRRAFGIEFRGTQYVAPNQQIAVVSHVEEPSPYTEGVVNITTSPQGTQAPSVLNLKTNVPETKDSAAAKPASKTPDEPWADDWNEELVDAADVANIQANQPSTTETAAATPEETAPPAPTATAATATVTGVEPANDEDDSNIPLPMGNAGPVADTSTKTETPKQVAETNGHAAGAIPPVTSQTAPATASSATTAPTSSSSTSTASSSPASTISSSPATTTAVTAGDAKVEDRMVKRTQASASHTQSTPVTTSTATASSTKDIQVASLPPAEASKPDTATTASGEPKKLVTNSGTTVSTQKVNNAKIYTVQIASFRKESEAAASWQMLKTEQADLAALPHNVEKADLGKDKGIYYRLQAGSFNDKKDAASLCSSLQKRSIECMVVESKQVSMNDTPAAAPAVSSIH